MYKVVRFKQEEPYLKDFLDFPKSLYKKKFRTQNEKDEREILLGQHVLSKYFTVQPLLVYSEDGGKLISRALLTSYPEDDSLYFGYFESLDNRDAVLQLFSEIEKIAEQGGYKRIIGPIDCSFWIKYRLKTDHFENRPYIGEPYNRSYYLNLLENCGLSVSERYLSNSFLRLDLAGSYYQKYLRRFASFKEKGYQFFSPTKDTFDRCMSEIYQLVLALYADFPAFKPISENDFKQHFQYFKYISDFRMIKIAYFNGQAVAFLVTLPDYKNILTQKLTLSTKLKVFFTRRRANNYVSLYLGVKKEHLGLSSAIVTPVYQQINAHHAGAITALIHQGKITETYNQRNLSAVYNYVLLEKST
ncbi:MAG: hypothetical protein LBV19_01965 [Streptococcaceae bacterium]|jgi:hypothetical protein|nr:hypothetical protein [Streptococcaceae bacterium]